jgi:serine O-acetyltransferase
MIHECCCSHDCFNREKTRLRYFSNLYSSLKRVTYFYDDIAAIWRKDPALHGKFLSFLEIILYASFWAMFSYRISHVLFTARIPFLPRLLSQLSRLLTGIEIHPGAQIGPGLFIDHGSGVVIGETAILGKDILIFHGVTLGGIDSREGRRHPAVGDHVIIGAGAKVLGAIVIGRDAKIGAQTVVLTDIPEQATAVGIPAKIMFR